MCASKGKSIKNTHMFYYLLITWCWFHPPHAPLFPHPHYPIRITISTDYPLTIHCHITNPQHCTSPEIQIWPTYPIPHPGPHPFWSPPRTAACPPPCTPGPAVHWARPPPGGRPWPRGPRPAAGSARTRRRSTWGRRRSTCRWCTATWVGSSGIKGGQGIVLVVKGGASWATFWWWLILGRIFFVDGRRPAVPRCHSGFETNIWKSDPPKHWCTYLNLFLCFRASAPPCPILRYPECELFRNSLHTWNALVSHRRPGPGGPGTRRWRRRTCSGGWPWPPPSARPPGRRGACGRSSAAAIPGRWPGASPWSLGGKDKKYIKSMKFAKITRNGWYLDVSTPLLNWRLRV